MSLGKQLDHPRTRSKPARLLAPDAADPADAPHPHRWRAVEAVRLDAVLLGEEAFAPLHAGSARQDSGASSANDARAVKEEQERLGMACRD